MTRTAGASAAGARLAAAGRFLEQISTDILRSAAQWHATSPPPDSGGSTD
ncbi:hypothetical protein [Nocardia ninae]|nr:hypothetical protein [Nocardia ninae]